MAQVLWQFDSQGFNGPGIADDMVLEFRGHRFPNNKWVNISDPRALALMQTTGVFQVRGDDPSAKAQIHAATRDNPAAQGAALAGKDEASAAQPAPKGGLNADRGKTSEHPPDNPQEPTDEKNMAKGDKAGIADLAGPTSLADTSDPDGPKVGPDGGRPLDVTGKRVGPDKPKAPGLV